MNLILPGCNNTEYIVVDYWSLTNGNLWNNIFVYIPLNTTNMVEGLGNSTILIYNCLHIWYPHFFNIGHLFWTNQLTVIFVLM